MLLQVLQNHFQSDMDILKDNKLLIIIFLLLLSCTEQNCYDMEQFSGMSLKGKLIFIEKKEEWIPFNGDGYRLLVYQIRQDNLDEIINQARKLQYHKFDLSVDNEFFSNTIIEQYLSNGLGYYKKTWEINEIKMIIIDKKNKIIIYYYVLL